MATRISIDYDRQFTDAVVADIIARATTTINVLEQLGAAYQSLPGYEMGAYQTETDALEAKIAALQDLINQIRPLLVDIDALAAPLKDKNEGCLSALRGLLTNEAEVALLDQIDV